MVPAKTPRATSVCITTIDRLPMNSSGALAAMANSAAVSNKGGTPLFYAAMNGHVGCVHQLLLTGSDPHVETEWGTAEQQAQLKGHTAVVELLRNPPTMEAPQMPTLLVMNEEANE